MHKKTYPTLLLSGLFSLVFVASCKPRTYNSRPFEAPGTADKPELLGLPATLSWPAIKDIKTGERSLPWTDSYWPLYERGMAVRWAVSEQGSEGLTKLPETPYQQVTQMLAAWEANNATQLNLLSPAEKYELLRMGSNKPPADVLAALKSNEDAFQSSPQLKASRASLESIVKMQQQ